MISNMELKQILAAILFLLPGILSLKWVEYMTNINRSSHDNLEKTLLTIVYSFPSVMVTLLIIGRVTDYQITGFSDLTKTANDFEFLSLYGLLILITSFGTACLDLKIIRPIFKFLTNKYRDIEGLTHIEPISVWGKINDSNSDKIVFISSLSDPQTGVWGILEWTSLSSVENKEMIILGTNQIEKISSELTTPDYTYVDIENQSVIKVFICTADTIKKLNTAYKS